MHIQFCNNMNINQTYACDMQRITTYISKGQNTKLEQLAKSTGNTKSELIREAITQFSVSESSNSDDSIISDYENGFSNYINVPSFIDFATKAYQALDCHDIWQSTKALIERLDVFSSVVISAPRQSSKTSILCIRAVYQILFKKTNVTFYTLNTQQTQSSRQLISSLINKLSKVMITKSNSSILSLDNGFSIYFRALNNFIDEKPCELNYSHLIIIDEFAFARNVELMERFVDLIIQSAKHIHIIIASTPNTKIRINYQHIPVISHFYKIWIYAASINSPIRAIKLPKNTRLDANTFMNSLELIHNEINNEFIEMNSDFFIEQIGDK